MTRKNICQKSVIKVTQNDVKGNDTQKQMSEKCHKSYSQ